VAGRDVDVKELRHLLDASASVNSALDLPLVLRRILESAMALVGARYGALGVLDPTGTHLTEFLTIGVPDEDVRLIGALPQGLGVLGLLITDPQPIRLSDLSTHPDSFGFPPNHPRMTTFLGVPIRVRGEVFGNLHLTEKASGERFTETDEEFAIALAAAAAGVAIDNVRLHERFGELRMVEDRERVPRELHDTVVQRLFATGLGLQGLAARVDDTALAERLDLAVTDLDDTIRHIRTTIFELQRQRLPGRSLRREVLDIVTEVAGPAGLEDEVRFQGPVDLTVPSDLADQVLAVTREAVTNVARHADATKVVVRLQVADSALQLVVTDDGNGPPTTDHPEHQRSRTAQHADPGRSPGRHHQPGPRRARRRRVGVAGAPRLLSGARCHRSAPNDGPKCGG